MTSVNSSKADQGKIFEGMVARAFRELEAKLPVSFKRLVDSREAGNLIQAQESDYEFIVKTANFGAPYHFMLEAKSSDKYETFSPCFRAMVKPKQRAKMMLRERAGCKGFYLFFSSRTRNIELWDGSVINDAHPLKRQKLDRQPRMIIAAANLPDFALYMAQNPAEFCTTN